MATLESSCYIVKLVCELYGAGLPFSLARSAKFGLFWNCLPEIKWFDHFAIFLAFWMLKKIVNIKACFGNIWTKPKISYEILNFNLCILTNFWRKIWPLFSPFSYLRIWSFWNYKKTHLAFFSDLATLIWGHAATRMSLIAL